MKSLLHNTNIVFFSVPFISNIGCNLKEELNLVKKKIYSELVLKKEGNIYEPHKFREFCISAGANKLFDTILSAITTPRQSTDRTNLNQKRVVSIIYNLCYCLSQTCYPLQIDHALYLRSSQVNQEGMETEHILCSTNNK